MSVPRWQRGLWLGLLLITSCRDTPPEQVAPQTEGAPQGENAPGAAGTQGLPEGPAFNARRPSLRHYFAREGEQCTVYSADGETSSPPTEVPCPNDTILAAGERIRMTGKVCLRESPTDPTRLTPVVCPGPLIGLYQPPATPKD